MHGLSDNINFMYSQIRAFERKSCTPMHGISNNNPAICLGPLG